MTRSGLPSGASREQPRPQGEPLAVSLVDAAADAHLMVGGVVDDVLGEAGVGEPPGDPRHEVRWPPVAGPDDAGTTPAEPGEGTDGGGDVLVGDVAEDPAYQEEIGGDVGGVGVGQRCVAGDHPYLRRGSGRPRPGTGRELGVLFDEQPQKEDPGHTAAACMRHGRVGPRSASPVGSA